MSLRAFLSEAISLSGSGKEIASASGRCRTPRNDSISGLFGLTLNLNLQTVETDRAIGRSCIDVDQEQRSIVRLHNIEQLAGQLEVVEQQSAVPLIQHEVVIAANGFGRVGFGDDRRAVGDHDDGRGKRLKFRNNENLIECGVA